jgi:hypothetical protein
MLVPMLFSDLNGEFKGVKNDVQKASDYNRYTVFSLRDTYMIIVNALPARVPNLSRNDSVDPPIRPCCRPQARKVSTALQ